MTPPLRLVTFGGLGVPRGGAPAEGAGAQPRRLALLALLAAAGERGSSREKLLGLLWPESDLERARKNLAQAVYALRRDLGAEELVIGTTELRLNTDLCGSDLADFRAAIREDRLADAVTLYRGPFPDGIYLDEAPEFERWAETERTAPAHEDVDAQEKLATQTAAKGDARAAVGYWRLLANADPLNAQSALGLMRALAAVGDRAAALQHYRVYEMLLRQELDLAPDAAVVKLAEEVRRAEDTRRGGAEAPPRSGQPHAGGADRTGGATAPPLQPLPSVPVSTIPGTPAVTRPAPVPEPSARKHISGFTDEYARPRPVPEREPGRGGAVAPPHSGQPHAGGADRTGGAAAPPHSGQPHAGGADRTDGAVAPPLRRPSKRRLIITAFTALTALTALYFGVIRVRLFRTDVPATPVVAVGMIKDYTRSEEEMARPLGDMLATDLARHRGLQVI